jgi:hypothetical protein
VVVDSVKEEFKMRMDEVRKRAKALGIKTSQIKKADLIQQIQETEGNFDCFGSAKDYCDQWNCRFREDCLPSIDFLSVMFNLPNKRKGEMP